MSEPLRDVRLDHIAFGVRRIADVPPLLVGELGGRPRAGGPGKGGAFNGAQWTFPDRGKIEVLEPAGPPGGFMHRFLEARGPGLHHMTFLVPDIHRARARAEALGYRIVGFDDSRPRWKEAFVHPKSAPVGVVVQMAELDLDAPGEGWRADWDFPPSPEPADPAARIEGPRFTVEALGDAHRMWGELLGGDRGELSDGTSVCYRWPRSCLRVVVSEDPDGENGPRGIEVTCSRPLALPTGPHPVFGLPFVQVNR
ncbi:MAG: VOC family protein [Myxococcota bacterium]